MRIKRTASPAARRRDVWARARTGALLALGPLLGCPAPPAATSGKPAAAQTQAPPTAVADGHGRPAKSGAKVVPATAEASWRARAVNSTFPAAGRLIALGDLHGDFKATLAALRLGGLIDAEERWIGGTTTVVQTGDQLDRGDDEPEILALLDRLRKEAMTAGGAVYVLNGNHEIMNAAGDLRYVTRGGFADYVSYDDPNVPVPGAVPEEARGRMLAFRPGADIANTLADRKVIAVVGDSIFVHGGVRAKWAEYGLDQINEEASAWLRGESERPPRALLAKDGPVWDRSFSLDTSEEACEELARVLTQIGVARMVVGHTVQSQGITSACGGLVWRIDVGMSAHYGGAPSVLEIDGDEVRVLPPPLN